MYRNLADIDYQDIITNKIISYFDNQTLEKLLQGNLQISSASIGYFGISGNDIQSYSNILNLNSDIINLNGSNINLFGNLNINTNNINELLFKINSINLIINDVLIEFAQNSNDLINNRGFVFPWLSSNNIIQNGFIGFDTTSHSFKLVNNLTYNQYNNVSIIPDYTNYGTLEILNLKLENIYSQSDNLNINSTNINISNNLNIINKTTTNILSINNYDYNLNINMKDDLNLYINNDKIILDTNIIDINDNQWINQYLFLNNNLENKLLYTYLKIKFYDQVIFTKPINLQNNIFIQNCPIPINQKDVANKQYIDDKVFTIKHNSVSTNDEYWKLFENISDTNNLILGTSLQYNTVYIKKGTPDGTQITLTDQDIVFQTRNEIVAMIDNNGQYNTLSDKNAKHSIQIKNINQKDYLSRFKKLNIYSYCYKNPHNDHLDNQVYIGIIQQEIKQLFNGNCLNIKKMNLNHSCSNNCQNNNQQKNRYVNYNELLCYLILAFKTLIQKNEDIELKNIELKNNYLELKNNYLELKNDYLELKNEISTLKQIINNKKN